MSERLSKRQKQSSEKEVEFSKLISVKECPICGGELEQGYFHIPGGASWCAEKPKGGFLVLDRMIPHAPWTESNLPALKCEKCGIVVIDDRAPRYTPKSFLKKCVKCNKEIPIASEECDYCGAKQP